MAERTRALPMLATLQEQGLKGFECYTWNAILAPSNTPQQFIARLNKAMNQALDDPEVFKLLQEVGVDPTPGSTPEGAANFIKPGLTKWAPIIQASGGVSGAMQQPPTAQSVQLKQILKEGIF